MCRTGNFLFGGSRGQVYPGEQGPALRKLRGRFSPSFSSLNSSSVPNLRMSSSSCLDMEPALEPSPGRTTRCVSIIFLLATCVIRSSTDARVTNR